MVLVLVCVDIRDAPQALASRPDFDLANIKQLDAHGSNFFHLAALNGFPRCLSWVAQEVVCCFQTLTVSDENKF